MNPIKPPGASPPTLPISPAAPAPLAGTTGPRGPAEVAPAATAAPTDPTAATLADLRAGRISPDAAVGRLTDAALSRAKLPEARRAAVEGRVRDLLAHDPTVAALLGRMGATVPSAEGG